jgi:LAO/AO transport system kinase
VKTSPPQELAAAVRAGDRGALARGVTLVESTRADHREAADVLLAACLPHSGASLRVGITGVPGVGKSTFIEVLGSRLVDAGRRVAVLAVDPTSTVSGGSILGDKTRMQQLASHPSAYVRPSPSGGSPGGVARRSREVIVLCEAAGFDTVFVETVGVGQAETAVHGMVDFFLLLALSGAGDDLQGIKRGIIEMADAIAVTKSDGARMEATERAKGQFAAALRLFPPTESGWNPPVHSCSARTGKGMEEIWADVLEFERSMKAGGHFEHRRRQQADRWLHESLDDRLLEALHSDPEIAEMLDEYAAKVRRREVSASAAAEAIVDAFRRLR